MKKTVFNVVTYTVTFLCIQLLCLWGVQALWSWAHPESKGDLSATAMVIAMALSSVATLALFVLAHWAMVSPTYLRSRPWAVFFWCVLTSIGALVPSVYLQELMPELPNVAEQTFDMILRDRLGYVAIGLLVPLAEELVFRGAVLRELLLRCSRHWVAIALSALIFALVHANPAQMPHAFLIGLLLGWMYYRTRSILPGVVYHWVNNSAAYVLYNLYPDPTLTLADLFGGNERTVHMAVGFSLLILLPSLYQLWLRLRPAR